MPDPELTDELIAKGMAPTEKVACRADDHRCYSFPNPLKTVRASCRPMGRCRIGGIHRVILANAGRKA